MEAASKGGNANELRLQDQQAYIATLQVSPTHPSRCSNTRLNTPTDSPFDVASRNSSCLEWLYSGPDKYTSGMGAVNSSCQQCLFHFCLRMAVLAYASNV